jgi:YggT family protein
MLLLEILHLILNTVAALLGGTLMLRAYLSWLRLGRQNPLAQFSVALTDWLVAPLRGLIPGRARWDWPCLVAALLVAVAIVIVFQLLAVGGQANWQLVLPSALALMLRWALYMLMLAVFFQVLLSLVNPHAPLAPTFDAMTRPLLAPFRRVIPLVGGFDVSPVAFLILVQILLAVLDWTGF